MLVPSKIRYILKFQISLPELRINMYTKITYYCTIPNFSISESLKPHLRSILIQLNYLIKKNDQKNSNPIRLDLNEIR